MHFRMAESQFLRMSEKGRKKVTKAEFIGNIDVEQRYNRKKEEFETSNAAVEEIFVFHGTESAAIDKIATEGFKIGGTEGVAMKHGRGHGHGVYTTVNPDLAMAYCRGSKMKLLSIAILGEFGKHYNFGATKDVLVIKDVDQLLPIFVFHYSD